MSSESYSVLWQPTGQRFECATEQTLLLAGLAAGVALPWSCRTGTCRTCLARCISGRIEHRIPWPGLSAEEKAQGLILPCVAEPRSDLVLASPEAAPTPRA